MSDIAKIDAGPMVQLSPQTAKMLTERPLLAVPPELRQQVFQTWAAFRHLPGLDTPAPIAFAASLWVNQHGYPAEDVREALVKLTGPLHMRKVRFVSDLTAEFAEAMEPNTPEGFFKRYRREQEAKARAEK